MFKFKIIDWEKQNAWDPFVDLIFDKIPFLQEGISTLENQETTTLIITDPGEQNIIGRTSLVKRELSHLQEDIRRLIPTGTFHSEYVWECSNLCCVYSPDPSPSEHISRSFYRSLFEGLVKFGQQKKIGFVLVKLTAEAYPPTKDLGSWPYIIEFFPQEFPEDLFYGILPLRGCFYEEYQKKWGDGQGK